MKFYKILLCLFIALMLMFSACDDDDDIECDCDGAWEVIETIVLSSDTNIVTFDGISEEWEVLEIQGYGSVNDSAYSEWNVSLRFNEDCDSNYSTPGDRIGFATWSISVSNFFVTIYPDHGGSGYHSCNWHIDSEWGSSSGGGWHNDPDGEPIHRIDIFSNPDSIYEIASGSEFILLGLDAH